MFLIPLLLIILIIWFFAYMFNPTGTYFPPNHTIYNNNIPSNKPMEILKERYAKGEISEEEYLKIKRNLE